jgi:hypothetical protein
MKTGNYLPISVVAQQTPALLQRSPSRREGLQPFKRIDAAAMAIAKRQSHGIGPKRRYIGQSNIWRDVDATRALAPRYTDRAPALFS